MRSLLVFGALFAATAAPALAQEVTVTGNIALATDYTFRGLSQTDSKPAVQGGFDLAAGSFYAGAWGSNVDFGFGESIELDLYGGFKFPLGPIAMDVGAIAYLYPGASDDGLVQGTGELDYYEGYVKGSIAPAEGLTIGGAAHYSPEYTGETGDAYYFEINGALVITPALTASAAYGYQDIGDVTGVFPGDVGDDYSTWNVGGTYSAYGLGFDLRYVGTSVGSGDPIVANAFTSDQRADGRVVFSIKRAM